MDAISAAVPDLQRESAAALNQPFYCHLGGGDGPLYVKLTPFSIKKISFRLFFRGGRATPILSSFLFLESHNGHIYLVYNKDVVPINFHHQGLAVWTEPF